MFALRRAGLLRRAALGTAGVVALGLTGRHQAIALSSSTPSDAALGALWGEAIDGMIDVRWLCGEHGRCDSQCGLAS
jgi:hypothetical protein